MSKHNMFLMEKLEKYQYNVMYFFIEKKASYQELLLLPNKMDVQS